jgi:acetyl esterase/lipase/NRPS condensation-like uncharacterized protein
MSFKNRADVVFQDAVREGIKTSLVIPRDEIRTGLILYIHGGGYTAGGIEYAKGFASTLSSKLGMRVLTFEYRLAPENPYPAALDDTVAAYKACLDLGYSSEYIVLAGESAGGGLCYALALKIKELSLPRPAGILAISPWCDLTLSGASYKENQSKDPSLSYERLRFFADSYIGSLEAGKKKGKLKMKSIAKEVFLEEKKNPFVSPIFASLSDLPPSLIFAGGDEMLLSDANIMHERLSEAGSDSKLVIKEKMWHAYLLYGLKSQKDDYITINAFLKKIMPAGSKRKLHWTALDNAAKIFPAAATSHWTNVFRHSATLYENVDREVLQSALDVTVRRFPSIAVRLRRGTFWYYLEEIAHAPSIMDELPYPISRMRFKDIRNCAFRVLIYKKRIAVEFFHALTDGNGGLVFLKTLLAEYLAQKYGIEIPNENGVLDRLEAPNAEELVDNFPKIAGKFPKSRRDTNAYRIYGTKEPDSFLNNTTFIMDADALLSRAKEEKVTVTALLAAALMKAAIRLQASEIVHERNFKPVKILLPCDLRRMYPGCEKTLRNFVLYATPGVDPRFGEYSFSELASLVYHQMLIELNDKNISAMVKTNVKDEENIVLRLVPLFIKNAVMKLVFELTGERKSTLSLSNLGVVKIPEIMENYIERFDFTLGVQSHAPYNTGLVSYKGKAYLNFIRNINEPRLEFELYRVLREEGIKVKVESNKRD